jgi:hypothetical protein
MAPLRYAPSMAAARLFVITACTGAALLMVFACGSSSNPPAGTSGTPGVDASSGSTGNDGSSPADGSDGSSGSSGSSGKDAGPDAALPRARGIVTSALAACPPAGAVVTIGSFMAPATPVEDGATQGGHGVSVNCLVADNGMGFDVDTTVSVGSVGVLRVRGAVDPTGASSMATVTLDKLGTGEWVSTTCTLDPNVSPGMSGIADGRYWAGVHCTGASTEGQPACDIDAQIRVENCKQ